MMRVLRIYLKYIIWVIIIAAFSYMFEAIYASGSSSLFLTAFIVLSLGLVVYATG